MNGKGCICIFLGLVLCVPFVGTAVVETYNSIIFDREIGGHLKRAADANSIDLAKQELEISVKVMENWSMTSGYTSVVYTTPDEDVGFWYKNIKSCLDQMKSLPDNASQGDKDLVLMKLRQTLLDHKGGNERVTTPPGISLFPYNTTYCVVNWVSLLLGIVGGCLVFAGFVVKD
jgi:hypothetical protein